MSDPKERTLSLFTPFTDKRLAELGDTLAKKRVEMDDLKSERSGINNTINDLNKEVLQMSRQIRRGGDDQFVKCEVWYNTPKPSEKTIRRTDSGQEWTEEMTDDDYSLLAELDSEPEESLTLELPPASIESVFGFNPGNFDYFIGNTVEDFSDNGIDISETDLRTFGRRLYVKASFQDIRELTDQPFRGKFDSDVEKKVHWYMFEPLDNVDIDNIPEAEVMNDEEEADPEVDDEN